MSELDQESLYFLCCCKCCSIVQSFYTIEISSHELSMVYISMIYLSWSLWFSYATVSFCQGILYIILHISLRCQFNRISAAQYDLMQMESLWSICNSIFTIVYNHKNYDTYQWFLSSGQSMICVHNNNYCEWLIRLMNLLQNKCPL